MHIVLPSRGLVCSECKNDRPLVQVGPVNSFLCTNCLHEALAVLRRDMFAHLPAKERMHSEMAHWGMSYKKWYKEYLQSDHWHALRKEKIKQVGREKCEQCGTLFHIQCHHLNYRNIYDVTVDDLQLLCKGCHDKVHAEKKAS